MNGPETEVGEITIEGMSLDHEQKQKQREHEDAQNRKEFQDFFISIP